MKGRNIHTYAVPDVAKALVLLVEIGLLLVGVLVMALKCVFPVCEYRL